MSINDIHSCKKLIERGEVCVVREIKCHECARLGLADGSCNKRVFVEVEK